MSDTPPINDWVDVRDDDGVLLFRWSPRSGMIEVVVRCRRAPGDARHHTEKRQISVSVLGLEAPDAQAVDSAMAVVV